MKSFHCPARLVSCCEILSLDRDREPCLPQTLYPVTAQPTLTSHFFYGCVYFWDNDSNMNVFFLLFGFVSSIRQQCCAMISVQRFRMRTAAICGMSQLHVLDQMAKSRPRWLARAIISLGPGNLKRQLETKIARPGGHAVGVTGEPCTLRSSEDHESAFRPPVLLACTVLLSLLLSKIE